MIVSVWFFRALLSALLLLSVSGCVPASQSELEEEKEPHFLAGKNSINSRDYRGAIAEFERALEVNPRNSKAHYQLGWLYEEKESDPAAAIYHYERYLKLRPSSENAEVIRQRVTNCKQDLAKTVLPLPITPGMQRQLDRVIDENKRLKEENQRWKDYFASRPQMSTSAPAAPLGQSPIVTPLPAPATALPVTVPQPRPSSPTVPAAVRTHVVQAGETPASISRRYGVSLTALLKANPTLEPRRMKVGQIINVPASR